MKTKNILVTGASSGFGKIATQILLKRGHRVMAGLRGGQARLEELFAEELRQYPPGTLTAVDLHLERPETLDAVPAAIAREFDGRLDVLVNNAGFALIGAFEAQTDEQVANQFNVNFFGPIRLTRLLLPAIRRARGTILNVSSVGGRVGVPYMGTYTASKHALEAHTEGLYYELKPFGIQVGLVEPGAFRTHIVKSYVAGSDSLTPRSPYYLPTRNFERFNSQNLKYAGDPVHVARRIANLAEARRVPIRTLVGADARIMLFLKWLLPENFRVSLTELLFRKAVLRTPKWGERREVSTA